MTTPGTLKRHKRASREATKERAPPTVEGQIHSHQRLKQTSSRVKTQEKQARKRKGAGAVRWQRGGELGKAVGSAKLLRVQPWFVLSNSGLLTSRFPSHGGFSHGKMKNEENHQRIQVSRASKHHMFRIALWGSGTLKQIGTGMASRGQVMISSEKSQEILQNHVSWRVNGSWISGNHWIAK